VEEVIGTARQLAQQNKNRLVIEVQEKVGTITVDPMRLRQILLNHRGPGRLRSKRTDDRQIAVGVDRIPLDPVRVIRTRDDFHYFPLF
jgi:hypothetical protein